MGKKTKSNSAVAKAPWNRTGNVSVDVDQVRIDSLLQQRSDCKANKNFGEADEIAKTLRDMNVCRLHILDIFVSDNAPVCCRFAIMMTKGNGTQKTVI